MALGAPVTPPPAPIAHVEAQYAGFVSRCLAMLIDLLILATVLAAGGIAINFFVRTSGVEQLLSLLAARFAGATRLDVMVAGASLRVIATLAVSFGYFAFFYTFGGATVGKYLLGLRVVTSDGRRLPPARACLRTLAYALSALPLYVGFLAVLVSDRRRGWHDRLAGTAVVYRWRARPDEEFLRELTGPE